MPADGWSPQGTEKLRKCRGRRPSRADFGMCELLKRIFELRLVLLTIVQVKKEMLEFCPPTAPSSCDNDANGTDRNPTFGLLLNHSEVSKNSIDLLDDNLYDNDRTRATGFIGAASEVHWLRAVAIAHSERIRERSGGRHQQTGSYARLNEGTSLYSFWIDSDVVELEPCVNLYELPPRETAERLLSCYMSKVHDSFPILIRATFEAQFRRYFTALQNGSRPCLTRNWQAVLNMIFAIGAYHSYLKNANWRENGRDHFLYQARSRALHLEDAAMTRDLDVPQIKGLGLLAFYWMSIGHIDR